LITMLGTPSQPSSYPEMSITDTLAYLLVLGVPTLILFYWTAIKKRGVPLPYETPSLSDEFEDDPGQVVRVDDLDIFEIDDNSFDKRPAVTRYYLRFTIAGAAARAEVLADHLLEQTGTIANPAQLVGRQVLVSSEQIESGEYRFLGLA
jgi:hypothetical protein